jgi:hypothetical protein
MRPGLTPEDCTAWSHVAWGFKARDQSGKPANRAHAMNVLHRLSQELDRTDSNEMRWITQQADYARRQDQRYGRGKRLSRVHPLARIGMGA